MAGVRFTQESAERVGRVVKQVEGTSQGLQLRPRNPRHPRSGGSQLVWGLAEADIDAVTIASREVTPGATADAVALMEYDDSGSDGKWTVKQTGDPAADVLLSGVNVSKTEIRASSGEPVVVLGFRRTVKVGGSDVDAFVVTNVMDFRALPGFVVGDAPAAEADDDADLQIPYHSGGSQDFQLDSGDCDGS